MSLLLSNSYSGTENALGLEMAVGGLHGAHKSASLVGSSIVHQVPPLPIALDVRMLEWLEALSWRKSHAKSSKEWHHLLSKTASNVLCLTVSD